MKVLAVGTGCTWFERNNTSFIIDDKILFDTPSGSYKDIIKSDEDVLSIALFGDVAIKYLTKRNEEATPTVINLKA